MRKLLLSLMLLPSTASAWNPQCFFNGMKTAADVACLNSNFRSISPIDLTNGGTMNGPLVLKGNLTVTGTVTSANTIIVGTVTYAQTAGAAATAVTALTANTATTAVTATSADYASAAGTATSADYASAAGTATYATSAGTATYATSAGTATLAPNYLPLTGGTVTGRVTLGTTTVNGPFDAFPAAGVAITGYGTSSSAGRPITGVGVSGIGFASSSVNAMGVYGTWQPIVGAGYGYAGWFDGDVVSTGVVTASSFSGSASGLTSIPAARLTGAVPTASVNLSTVAPINNPNFTGTATASTAVISSATITNLNQSIYVDGTNYALTAAGINSALNALCAQTGGQGGTVVLPNAWININSTIYVGSSTCQNMVLVGQAAWANSDAGQVLPGTTLTWTGAAGSTVISVSATPGAGNGALNKSGVKNLVTNCANSAAYGINIASVHGGEFKDLWLADCTGYAVLTDVVSPLAEYADTQQNTFANIYIRDYNATNGGGFYLGGTVSANTSFNNFRDLHIQTLSGIGIYEANDDSNLFENTSVGPINPSTAVYCAGGYANTWVSASFGGGGSVGYYQTGPSNAGNTIFNLLKNNGQPEPVVTGGTLSYTEDGLNSTGWHIAGNVSANGDLTATGNIHAATGTVTAAHFSGPLMGTASYAIGASTAAALAAAGSTAGSGFICRGVDASGNCIGSAVDVSAVSGSTNPVQSGAMYTALAGKQASGSYALTTGATFTGALSGTALNLSQGATAQSLSAPLISVTTPTINGVTYTLPAAHGALNTMLTENGSGTLTWQAPGSLSLPVGMAIIYISSTCPAGFLALNGASVSTSTYANLCGVIGYNSGNGFYCNPASANFTLPNTQALFVRGYDVSGSTDTGRAFGSYEADQMQGHYHTSLHSGFLDANGTAGGSTVTAGNFIVVDGSTGSPVTDGTNGTPRTGKETRPMNIAMQYCVKY